MRNAMKFNFALAFGISLVLTQGALAFDKHCIANSAKILCLHGETHEGCPPNMKRCRDANESPLFSQGSKWEVVDGNVQGMN